MKIYCICFYKATFISVFKQIGLRMMIVQF